MKNKIFQLSALLIFIFGILAIAFLAMAKANHLIDWLSLLGAVVIICIVIYLDSKWILKHFIDGEWV